MENSSQSPEFNSIESRIAQLEADLQIEREKNAILNQAIVMQKLLMEELAEKDDPALEAEYRAIMQEQDAGRTVDGAGLLLAVSKIGGAA